MCELSHHGITISSFLLTIGLPQASSLQRVTYDTAQVYHFHLCSGINYSGNTGTSESSVLQSMPYFGFLTLPLCFPNILYTLSFWLYTLLLLLWKYKIKLLSIQAKNCKLFGVIQTQIGKDVRNSILILLINI